MNNIRERYAKGVHTVLDVQYHYVWKTKYSYKVLNGGIALRLRDLLREVCSLREITIVRENIRADHVHILVRAPSYLLRRKLLSP
jgi:putative transposase